MARAPFVFFRRGSRFYVQFWNPDRGFYGTAHSTGAATEGEALGVVVGWLREGITARPRRKDSRVSTLAAGTWLEAFWTESSAYVVGKRARGDSISTSYIKNSASLIRRLFTPRLGAQALGRVRTAELESWVLGLYEEGTAPRTVNQALLAVSVAMKEAARLGIIQANPAAGVRAVKENPSERGILLMDEVKALFSVSWTDNRAKTASFLSASTGMRMGEIRGLLYEDLELEEDGRGLIDIRHNWVEKEGLKTPKAGSYGQIPIPAPVGLALRMLMAASPWHGPYVFYGDRPDRPVGKTILDDGLRRALKQIKIDEEARRDRGLCFHSWRSFANAHLRRKVSDVNLRKVTRHRQAAMTERYDRLLPEDLAAVRGAQDAILAELN